jgi:hypothetical protein
MRNPIGGTPISTVRRTYFVIDLLVRRRRESSLPKQLYIVANAGRASGICAETP